MRRFNRGDVFNQALGLLIHFCNESGIPAWLARGALARLCYLAAVHFIARCFASIELFVVTFKLLALARRIFVLPGCARETLRAALPA